jgi:SAM-dependent methyltransferase
MIALVAVPKAADRRTKHWNDVAEGWAAWLDWTERNFEPLTRRLGEAAGWAPGIRALDVACGAGYPALAAARAVRPHGRIVAIDLSTKMIAAAAARAAAERLDNIDFAIMDFEALTFDDASFEAITNACGLMFCRDPARALGEMWRVLTPNGRVALATWADPALSPFFTAIRDVAADFLALPAQAPSDPGPFRFSAPDAMRTLLGAAGFGDVRVETLPMTFECESVDQYCRIFTDIAWRSRMAALPAEKEAAFRQAVGRAAQPYLDAESLKLPAVTLVASGRKTSG